MFFSSPEVYTVLFQPIYRYFNVIGSDPEGRLGEAPRPELREHGRISGACFDAARGIMPGLQVNHFFLKSVFPSFPSVFVRVLTFVLWTVITAWFYLTL